MEMEIKNLQDEFVILKTAIEEAINKGQKSLDDIDGIYKYGMEISEDVALTYLDAGSGVVGWVDDF